MALNMHKNTLPAETSNWYIIVYIYRLKILDFTRLTNIIHTITIPVYHTYTRILKNLNQRIFVILDIKIINLVNYV